MTDKELKIIGQKLEQLDYLFTTAGNYDALYYFLMQMVTIANEIGIDVVKPEEVLKRYHALYSKCIDVGVYIQEMSKFRAKIIVECVKRGIIERFREIPIGVMSDEANSKQIDRESVFF